MGEAQVVETSLSSFQLAKVKKFGTGFIHNIAQKTPLEIASKAGGMLGSRLYVIIEPIEAEPCIQ